jgi:Fic family protein
MLKPTYQIPALPPLGLVETPAILRAAALAHRKLAEVKGRAASIPNPEILINTLSLQEALASSAIENIVTTEDELFQAAAFPETEAGPAKEVALYRDALRRGFARMTETKGLLTTNVVVEMFQILKRSTGGFRETSGTALKNQGTGQIVFVPPQDRNEIVSHMTDLEAFVNVEESDDPDPLVKMAIIHHQFESIHPFPDGNGRIGRILNVLYLTRAGLLDAPILYLSRYINANKSDYYRLLQAVRDDGNWEEWVLFMLRGVSETSQQTLGLVEGIRALMQDYKQRIRTDLPKIYSQDLLNNLFRHPYTRIEIVQNELGTTRQTASKYLDQLTESGFVSKHAAGRRHYFINDKLVALFVKSAGPES